VCAVLICATVVERVLALRGPPDTAAPVLENLRERLKAWWAMVAVLSLAFVIGNAGILLLFAFASFMALREFLTLMHTRRSDHWALFAAFFAVLPVQYYLIAIDWYGLYSIFIPVYAFLLLPVSLRAAFGASWTASPSCNGSS
jgi:phosphatidate cytidylyltransferase